MVRSANLGGSGARGETAAGMPAYQLSKDATTTCLRCEFGPKGPLPNFGAAQFETWFNRLING
jgi:hypothetical protein